MSYRITFAALVGISLALPAIHAQSPTAPLKFEVVSIKRNTSGAPGNNIRTLPDGTVIATNVAMALVIRLAIPVQMLQVLGLPDWAQTDRYDITAKPPEGFAKPTAEQRTEMLHSVVVDRLKLQAHVEDRQRDTYALVLAHANRKLGPQLKPSTLDCSGAPPDSPPPPPPSSEWANRCGVVSGMTYVRSGGTTMDELATSAFAFAVGARVYNRTSLDGRYALQLDFRLDQTRFRLRDDDPRLQSSSDLPDIFTAVQEQLGLKLVPQKTQEPVFVVDHLERPSEN
jgi:uncharacterized protein (TIGR03435 family)